MSKYSYHVNQALSLYVAMSSIAFSAHQDSSHQGRAAIYAALGIILIILRERLAFLESEK